MGCCQSREHGEGEEEDEERHTVSASAVGGERGGNGDGAEVNRDGDNTNGSRASRHRQRRRPLQEHYNQPLRRHEWRASSKRQWTHEELDREREEYFDTRVTGRTEAWHALRTAVDLMPTDLGTAQGILDAAGVTVPTGDLVDGAYDEFGNLYQMPEHVLSDPSNVVQREESKPEETEETVEEESDAEDRRREEKGKAVFTETETIQVTARLSDRGGPDVTIDLGQAQPVRVLTRRIQDELEIRANRVRIAYMGRILKENESLSAQGWQSGHIVNALVFPTPK